MLVGLLEHAKQPKLSDKEVICLEVISEGAEVEVKHFTRRSQKIFYIHWEGLIVFIQSSQPGLYFSESCFLNSLMA